MELFNKKNGGEKSHETVPLRHDFTKLLKPLK
jgi:hypothetical protein